MFNGTVADKVSLFSDCAGVSLEPSIPSAGN